MLRMLGLTRCCTLVAAALACNASSLELKACRVSGIRHEVLCGSVQRALNPAQPERIKIAVHYVVVPAKARRKLRDAVFLLAGGPGQSAISLAPSVIPLLARLNNRRDLVFVDQRGTGKSAPLSCPDKRFQSLEEQADPRAQEQLVLQCRDPLSKLPHVGGLDGLRYFTTTLAMQDLEAVRQQLGETPINLVGFSYGTRAALEYLRQHPHSVRRAVLDGVSPPDMVLPASVSVDTQAVFDKLLEACERDLTCTKFYPRLRANWSALLAGLPKLTAVAHPLTGRTERFTLTRELLLGLVRRTLYLPSLATALPAALREAAQGRLGPLVGLSARITLKRRNAVATGMHFSVVCSEDAPRMADISNQIGTDVSDGFADMYARVCAAWPRAQVPAVFYKLAAAQSPVLLLSGGLDPVTPPRHGDRVAKALGAMSKHVVVDNAGHGVLSLPCARDVLYRFINANSKREALDIDASCMADVPRPAVFVPVQPQESSP